jgi:hypothetical protein
LQPEIDQTRFVIHFVRAEVAIELSGREPLIKGNIVWKLSGWILTTLLLPVVIFLYQRFSDDIRFRQNIEAELNVIEFELAGRLGQFSSSFNPLVTWNSSPRRFHKDVSSDWLQSAVLELRRSPVIDFQTPVPSVKLLVAPVAPATKDTTLLGLFARGTFLQQQMLNFFELTFYQRVLAGGQASQDFCMSQRQKYLESVALSRKWDTKTRVEIHGWRPETPGTNNSKMGCLKAWKYQEAIAALLVPDGFVASEERSALTEKEDPRFERFNREFQQKLLWAVPDFDLPYVDTFAG